jgi:8-oxo-dGTP diphosphatase
MNGSEIPRPVIQIVAAVVQDEAGRVLLVRKKGTRAFMQPGGKLRASESHLAALDREIGEELNSSIVPDSPIFLGTFTAPAANENGCQVEAALYHVRLQGAVNASAEIEEIVWIDPHETKQIELAPLTRDFVLPLAKNCNSVNRVGPRDLSRPEGIL